MGRYLIRRFAELILTVFLIATATFFLLEAVPGDPLTQRADHLPEQTRTALYQRYGLDKPVMERYLITMKKMCKGESNRCPQQLGEGLAPAFVFVPCGLYPCCSRII